MKKKNTEVGMYRKEFQDDLIKSLIDAVSEASLQDRLNIVHTLSGLQVNDINDFLTPQGMLVGAISELLLLHR